MQSNIGVIKSSNLCSEITIYSDAKEYGVCVLGSVSIASCVHDKYSPDDLSLPEDQRRILNDTFPKNPFFDFEELIDHVKMLTINLNNIIEKNFYPVKETVYSNERHRPIGIGLQGLADAYMKLRLPFESDSAAKLNKIIMEVIHYAALSQSTKLSKKLYQKYINECKQTGKVVIRKYHPDGSITNDEYFDSTLIPKTSGAYPSMYWNGGSPLANGKFHWELYGIKPSDLSDSPKLDWDTLRDHIAIYGVRNSLTTALMPTATTSQFLGNNECFEPYTSNIYKRKTLAGEFIVINKYLIHDLYRLGIWNENIKNYLYLC
jgi:ribonucleotide reductase alpha subunit